MEIAGYFPLYSETGVWKSIIVPELVRNMDRNMMSIALGKSKPDFQMGGNKGPRSGDDEGAAAYAAGERLRGNGWDSTRGNAPVGKSHWAPLCRGYKSHSGRRSNEFRHVRPNGSQ